MTSQINITYPDGSSEQVIAKATDDPHLFEIAGHAFLMPLGPGDVVRISDDHEVAEVVSLEPQFIYHVDFHLPVDYLAGPMPAVHPAMRAYERTLGEWKRDAWVTELTPFIVVVSSQSAKWIDDKVATCKYVAHMTQTRTPDTREVRIEARPVL